MNEAPSPLPKTRRTTSGRAADGERLIAPFLQALHARGRLRVWSIVMTIFGDLVQPRGQEDAAARLAFSDLGRLTESLGIAPGALRTAMSRLTKEGWLERHKEGRNAWYQLSPSGEASTQSAGQRIYARHEPQPIEHWRLDVFKDAEAAARARGSEVQIPVGDQLVLTPLMRGAGEDELVVGGASLALEGRLIERPDWLLDSLVEPSVTQDYHELATLLEPLAADLPSLQALAPHDAAVLRCLLLHFWRRLVLKHRSLPASLLPDDWPGLRCSALMPQLYAALWPASEAWLDEAGLPPRAQEKKRPFA